jgi:hypothetical protein
MEESGQLQAPTAPGKRTHWKGRSVGPKADLEGTEKKKIPFPAMNWTPIHW